MRRPVPHTRLQARVLHQHGVCYDSMAQCTARTAQSNWMSVTGHHRCYEYKKERGRCVPKDAKPARGCYNDPDGCEAFGTPERTPERTPKTGLCLTTTADFAAAIGMAASFSQEKKYWACAEPTLGEVITLRPFPCERAPPRARAL